ncbi:hypothetical protein C8R48DRAFT_720059, partial [Suillus tomentosus]
MMFTIFLVAAAIVICILISPFKEAEPYFLPRRSFILRVIETFPVASISVLVYTGFGGFPLFLVICYWGIIVLYDLIHLTRRLLTRHRELDWFWRHSPELRLRYPNLKTKLLRGF